MQAPQQFRLFCLLENANEETLTTRGRPRAVPVFWWPAVIGLVYITCIIERCMSHAPRACAVAGALPPEGSSAEGEIPRAGARSIPRTPSHAGGVPGIAVRGRRPAVSSRAD